MPSYRRDPIAPVPNRSRLIGIVASIEIGGSIVAALSLWSAARPIHDASLASDGTPVVA